jgi:hypothetical protein
VLHEIRVYFHGQTPANVIFIKAIFNCGHKHSKGLSTMTRTTGTTTLFTSLGESVHAFVPYPLPPANPALAPDSYAALNHQAELALAITTPVLI